MEGRTLPGRRRDPWHSYRQRRAVLFFGGLIDVAALGATFLLGGGTALVIVISVAVFVHVLVAGISFASFPCPACDEEWFGVEAEAWVTSLGILLSVAGQKICNNCGLPKFMDPAEWNAVRRPPSEARRRRSRSV